MLLTSTNLFLSVLCIYLVQNWKVQITFTCLIVSIGMLLGSGMESVFVEEDVRMEWTHVGLVVDGQRKMPEVSGRLGLL